MKLGLYLSLLYILYAAIPPKIVAANPKAIVGKLMAVFLFELSIKIIT